MYHHSIRRNMLHALPLADDIQTATEMHNYAWPFEDLHLIN